MKTKGDFLNLITLTTDFGLRDPFVGMMKGVLYSINNSVNIVDISHGIESQNVIEGAFVITQSYRFFPERTIHIVVIDPGVGGSRRPLLVCASGHYFIGPDNGVLSQVITEDQNSSVIEITEEKYFLKGVSATFHGRDIFAPVAAWISKGMGPDSFGHVITDYTQLCIPDIEKGPVSIKGSVIYVDKFGNLITNIPGEVLNDLVQKGGSFSSLMISIGEIEIAGIKKYYAEVKEGEPGAIIGSFGLLEIFTYMGDAATIHNLRKGEVVVVKWILI